MLTFLLFYSLSPMSNLKRKPTQIKYAPWNTLQTYATWWSKYYQSNVSGNVWFCPILDCGSHIPVSPHIKIGVLGSKRKSKITYYCGALVTVKDVGNCCIFTHEFECNLYTFYILCIFVVYDIQWSPICYDGYPLVVLFSLSNVSWF